MEIRLVVNGTAHQLDVDPSTPLLWVLRDHLGMTGTKFGCGIAMCGACTAHVDGVATRSCRVPVEAVVAAKITTIEGLAPGASHPLQKAWLELNVPQCGYCQAGMLMAAAAFLKQQPRPTDRDIDAAITNLCRCGTYPRVRAAIHSAAKVAPFASGQKAPQATFCNMTSAAERMRAAEVTRAAERVRTIPEPQS
jgi:isoquinoline 1-oxidoreductase subunit alpha